MPLQPITLTEAELQLIEDVRGGAPPTNALWGDERLNAVRSRIKQHYLGQQNQECCYCKKRIMTTHGRAWDVEHVLSASQYPQFLFFPENLAVSCIDCNMAKLDEEVTTRRLVRFPNLSEHYKIIHPHFDVWEEHLFFGEFIFAPKSSKGGDTIVICKLFRYYEKFGQDGAAISDRRFEREVEQLLFATDMDEAQPSIAAIERIIERAAPRG